MAKTKDVKMARGKRNRVVVVVNKETAEIEREEDVCTLRLSRVALDRVYGPCTVWPRPTKRVFQPRLCPRLRLSRPYMLHVGTMMISVLGPR